MKKLISLIIFISLFSFSTCFGFSLFKKKSKPVLLLDSHPLNVELVTDFAPQNEGIFKINSRIYFSIYHPEGFKSNYIRYQVIKQDDNVDVGGYSRIRNVTCRLKNKNYYQDYIYITQKGKYYIQIFDIENLQQWVAIAKFLVVE